MGRTFFSKKATASAESCDCARPTGVARSTKESKRPLVICILSNLLNLELVVQPELNDAGLIAICKRADSPKVRNAAALIRESEVRVIQKVQSFHAELHTLALADRYVLQD